MVNLDSEVSGNSNVHGGAFSAVISNVSALDAEDAMNMEQPSLPEPATHVSFSWDRIVFWQCVFSGIALAHNTQRVQVPRY